MRDEVNSFETLPFFRGVSKAYPLDFPYLSTPRTNRRPRNLAVSLHEVADAWFEKRFGVRFRSQAIFVTSRILTAGAYGDWNRVVRVLPLDAYRFCWSKRAVDLLYLLKNENDPNAVPAILDAAEYIDCDLLGAHHAGCEVMLSCERYVAIPQQLLVDRFAKSSSG